jgi:hypothetical protein
MTPPIHFGPALRPADPADGRRIASQARRQAVALSCAAAACALLATGCGSAASGTSGSGERTPVAAPTDIYPGRPVVGPSASPGPGGSAEPSPCDQQPPGCAGAPQVTLDVTIYPADYPADNTLPSTLTLRCDPDGGTAPDPAAACAQLLAEPDLLEPQPVGHVIACPMILASGARIVVDGAYLGRQVNETIVDGGCDLQRWTELMQIFRPTNSGLQPVSPG